MQTDNRIFDDFARMAGGALNALTGLKTEIETMMRQQLEGFLANMKLVSRDEFEAVQAMAAKARDEQESLVARLDALEAELAALKGAGEPAAAAARRARKPKAEDAKE